MSVRFIFDRANKTYFAGETVKCKAILKLTQPLNLNSITIVYQGTAKTWWTGYSNGSNGEDSHECYGSMEQFLSETFICFQSFNGKTFHADSYEYNTEIKLPGKLPTSFIGRHGQVIYKINMLISSNLGKKILLEEETVFYVYSMINLNNYIGLRTPILKCKCKKIGLAWFKSEMITLTTKIAKKGFAIGENIPVVIRVDNQSATDIIYFEISLVERIVCKEKRKTEKKEEENVIWKKCIGDVLKYQSKIFDAEIGITDDLTILLLDGIDLIETGYSVVVKGFLKDNNSTIQTNSTVIFGTIPLENR